MPNDEKVTRFNNTEVTIDGRLTKIEVILENLAAAFKDHINQQKEEKLSDKTSDDALEARIKKLEATHEREELIKAEMSKYVKWFYAVVCAVAGVLFSEAARRLPLKFAIFSSAALLSGAVSYAANAATYYVAVDGNNANNGSLASPWATIAYANSQLKACDTLIVKPGTYAASIRTTASGTANCKIRYVSEPRGGARIVTPPNNTSDIAWEQTGNYVDVDGFEIDGSAHQSGTRWRTGIKATGQYNTIQGVTVHDIGKNDPSVASYGIHGASTGANIEILSSVVKNIGTASITNPPIEFPLTLQKEWTATSSTADYTFYAPAGTAFAVGQSPWGHWDMAAGDQFNAKVYTATNGYIQNRITTGPLRFGVGLPKGAPNVTFGDHFDYRPAVRPLGNGVWSNTIIELKASVGGTATAGSTGGYARALQIHGFRTAYTGSAWSEVSNTDGETYDIQIRYKTSGDFPRYTGTGSEVFRERKQLGAHTWDIYRTPGGWASDLGIGFQLVGGDLDAIENVDIKAILDYTLDDANARYNRNDTGIYVRGVQAWIEPRVGTIDATIENMVVRYNGTIY